MLALVFHGLFLIDKISHTIILHVSDQPFWGSILKIRVADITEKEKIIESISQATAYPTLVQVQEAGECTFLRPVTASLSVVKEYGYIRVKGSINTSLGLSCSRCLTDFSIDIDSNFTIYFTKSAVGSDETEVELSEEDLLSATYDGDEIDLTNEIAEQVLLELPYKPLCNEDCHGLCPVCGVDRNKVDCSCMDNQSGLAFSSLRSFKVKQ